MITMTEQDVRGRMIGVYKYKSKLKVKGIDVDGIFPDFTDFSGEYKKLAKSSRKYKEILNYFREVEGADVVFR